MPYKDPEKKRQARQRQRQLADKQPHYGYKEWTSEEDEVIRGPGTTVEKALRLHRTYYSIASRIKKLRKGSREEGEPFPDFRVPSNPRPRSPKKPRVLDPNGVAALRRRVEAAESTLTESRRLLTVALGYLEGVRAEEPYQPAWLNFATAMAVLRDFVLVEDKSE